MVTWDGHTRKGMAINLKIGIPRALLYYYYYPLWKKIFESLGMEIILSDETNKGIIEKGIKVTVSEFCVPIKIFNGHIIELMEKDVDYIFVPRFVSVDEEAWFCPKFVGLPDAVLYTVDGIKDRMLTINIARGKTMSGISHKRRSKDLGEDICELKYWLPICEKLKASKAEMKQALKEGKEYWKRFRALCIKGYVIDEAMRILESGSDAGSPVDLSAGLPANLPDLDKINAEAEITIGLIGYVYNIYDKFISMDAIKRLRAMNVKVITFEMFDEEELIREESRKEKSMFWIFTRKLHWSVRRLLKDNLVDGIIHMTAFACGPDSVLGKYLEIECEEKGVPFLTARLDEHTGESH